MTDHRARRLAWAFSGIVVLLYIVTAAARAINASLGAGWTSDETGNLVFVLSTTLFLVVGAIILAKQSRNPVGWILVAISFFWVVGGPLSEYARYGLTTRPGSVPAADVAEAITAPGWVAPIVLTGTFLLLLFPDGRLPSRRWRWVARLSGLIIVTASVGILLQPGTMAGDGYPNVVNPLGVSALKPLLAVLQATLILIPICIVASAASLVGRYRRSRGIQRVQLKWLATGAAAAALIYGVTMVASLGTSWNQADTPTWVAALQFIAVPAFALIPIAMGFAISRYRLYDIDRIINRTLVYGVLTGVLAAVYVGLVLGLGAVARSVGGSARSPVVVAASTLAAAGLFRSVRQRVQGFIDRRFYRRRYDAQRTLEAFSGRLRDEVDLDALETHLLGTVHETLEPANASLWLRREASP
jgi:hypothetical protein